MGKAFGDDSELHELIERTADAIAKTTTLLQQTNELLQRSNELLSRKRPAKGGTGIKDRKAN